MYYNTLKHKTLEPGIINRKNHLSTNQQKMTWLGEVTVAGDVLCVYRVLEFGNGFNKLDHKKRMSSRTKLHRAGHLKKVYSMLLWKLPTVYCIVYKYPTLNSKRIFKDSIFRNYLCTVHYSIPLRHTTPDTIGDSGWGRVTFTPLLPPSPPPDCL